MADIKMRDLIQIAGNIAKQLRLPHQQVIRDLHIEHMKLGNTITQEGR